jgi:hypothetical protein
MKPATILIALLGVLVIGFLLQRTVFSSRVSLPKGETEKIMIPDPNKQAKKTAQALETPKNEAMPSSPTKKDDADMIEIFKTNGVKHSIPLDEIIGGGPPKDGIPSIDNPKYISTADASDWLGDEEIGLSFSHKGVTRFYPFQILVFHEIVNDTIAGDKFLITYCPLCLSGIVFDPLVDGERVEFGTSGKLWQSNLVMYDRKTDSYWSQILGEAVVGEQTGVKLKVLPFDQMRFGNWKELNPNGEVLSRDTGAFKFYGRDPYGDYYTTPGVFFPVQKTDDRLDPKAFVLGVVIGNEVKAYLPEAIKEKGEITDIVGGTELMLQYQQDIDAVRMYKVSQDGTKERFNPIPNFWFSWVAAHPDTELYK